MLRRLTQKQLQTIFSLKPVYFKAQSLTGIPWQILAAIHYRERSLSTTASNPYQFDLQLTDTRSTTRRHLYSKYSTLTQDQTNKYVAAGINNFEAATVLAACFLKNKRQMHNITPDYSDEDVIKELFWSYNGRAYGGYNRSPYVMNDFDAEHKDMIISGTIDGKPISPRVDERPGAFTVYVQIKAAEEAMDKA